MKSSSRLDFDIAVGEAIPHQQTVRPEKPIQSVADLARFIEEIEELFGPIPHRERPHTGKRFLL
jgi:hypothetical protein